MTDVQKKQLEEVKYSVLKQKKFYKHLIFYLLLNILFTFISKIKFTIIGNFVLSNNFNENGFIATPIWLFWGIFLMLHALVVFVFPAFFGSDWRQKKINEYLK